MTWTINLSPSSFLNQEALDRGLIRDGDGPVFSDSPADAFRHAGASMIATYHLGPASVGCVLARTIHKTTPRP